MEKLLEKNTLVFLAFVLEYLRVEKVFFFLSGNVSTVSGEWWLILKQ